MNFLERLKEKLVREHEIEAQRVKQETTRQEVDRNMQLQKEADEKAYHELRKRQAEAIRQDSGVNILVGKLRDIIGGKTYGRGVPNSATDPDSICDGIVWDRIKVGTGSVVVGSWEPEGTPPQREDVDIFEDKFLVVESQPEGNIIFHGKRDLLVQETKWRNNDGMLEDALEQTYNNPGTIRDHGIPRSGYSDM